MIKEREALKLALELFEAGHSTVYGTSQAARVIAAIKEALADNALDRMAENARELRLDYEPPCKTGSQCTSKCQQCEQPAEQQEPEYAWPTVADYERDVGYQINEAFRIGWNMARTTNKMLGHSSSQPAQQQEPVAWTTWRELAGAKHYGTPGWEMHANKRNIDDVPLYTSPPASKPLTDEQIMEMYNEPRSDAEMLEFARAIEAKLRELNEHREKNA